MLRTLFAGIVALATLVALPAAACPNWQAAPTFGQIDLYSGFTPDPYARNITAGGTRNLANCFTGGFTGFVAVAPDFDLYWHGRSAQLTIAVISGADSVLLVSDPSGDWWYSDDYRGTNPAITFNNPQEGLYDIWIGTYDGSRRNPGQLIFTELGW